MNLVTGAVLSRHQIFMHVAGENVNAVVNGATMLGNGQLADSTLLADHAAVGGVGREMFKTVIDGDATGVFQGKIIVRQIAQKTDGKMKSDCLLLSDEGQMMNKPELEIFADDVACGHGATCGAPDQDLLFYLMARGLPKPIAESLLVTFIGGGLGVLIAAVAVRALSRVDPAAIPRAYDIALDGPVLLFAVALALISGLVIGLVPAVQTGKLGLAQARQL